MYKKNILRLKRAVYFFIKELKADPYKQPFLGDKYFCPICNTNLAYFNFIGTEYLAELDKYDFEYSMSHAETFNMINYTCPKCHSNDRSRLYALYFLKKTATIDKSRKYDMVEFAPGGALSDFFRKQAFLNYRTADLFMEGVDDRLDIMDMKTYKDSSFDIFLCSHVLEHVDDDRKAMKELCRILKPGGWGIVMAPIWTKGEKVLEDPKIVSEKDRWRYYGQGDHVRLYNKSGFVERLTDAGFKVNQYGVDYFGAEHFEKHGIHPRSILYVVEKI